MAKSRAREAFREARKDEILEAAVGVMAEQGADVSLNEIAEAAGLTRSALYRYFPSKEDLTQEVFARCFDSSKRTLDDVLERSGSPLEALKALIERSAAAYHQEGAREGMILNLQAALATATGASDAATPVIDRDVVEAAIRLAKKAKTDQELSPEADPVGVALLVLSTLQGLQMLIAMFGADIDSDAATDTLLAALKGFS
jgi:AcrR family transcriptional regulator